MEQDQDRKMLASKVYRCGNHEELYAALGGVLKEMAGATTSCLQLGAGTLKSDALLVFTIGDLGYTWAALEVNLNWSRFIAANTKRLYVIDDLGHGRDGRVWLVCNSGGSVGVVKIVTTKERAEKEASMWQKAYKEKDWSSRVRAQKWCKRWAVVMPRFSQYRSKKERMEALPAIRVVMHQNFAAKGLRHGDIKWRNIGYYLEDGEKKPVLLDLADVPETMDDSWIGAEMEKLKERA